MDKKGTDSSEDYPRKSRLELGPEESTDVQKCHGRISGYQAMYIARGEFANKLTRHVHEDIKHLGVANTMPTVREGHWIPHLRAQVKKVINDCKVFSAQPYGPAATAPLPSFRTEGRRPFETTRIDFAGLITYSISKKEQGNCYMLISRAVRSKALHLEVTRSRRAEEFKEKLNAFIKRRTRPKRIVSDNGAVFGTTAA